MNKACIALAAAAALTLVAAHCPKRERAAGPVDPDSGVVMVYVQPLPAAAAGLALSVESFAVVRDDGTTVPLELKLSDLSVETLSRQRLLAWGAVPPGNYTGFALKLATATIREQDQLRRLSLPEEATPSRFAFTAGAKQATLTTLDLDYGMSRGGEERFTPLFIPSTPSKLATGLIGVVASHAAGTLTLFDKLSGQVAGLIAVGGGPAALALDAPRQRLYVALAHADAVATVDLLVGTVLATFPLHAGDQPASLALSADGRTLLTANAGSSTVSLLDASGVTLFEKTRVEVGSGPRYITIDPSGAKAWVFNELDDSISILAVPGGGTVGTLASAGGPIRGDFSRSGTRLYVIHRSSPYLDVVDTATLALVQRVFVGTGARALKVDPKSGRIYLGFKDSGRLAIFESTSLLPTDHLMTQAGVEHLALDDEGNNLCISSPATDEVRLFRLVGKTLVAGVDVPEPVEVSLPGER